MSTPILLLCGQAGAGKDAVAKVLKDRWNAQPIAQADPIKRLAKIFFKFSDLQLWGPSEERNKPDVRFDEMARDQREGCEDRVPWYGRWTETALKVDRDRDQKAMVLLEEVLPGRENEGFAKMKDWLIWLAQQHGLHTMPDKRFYYDPDIQANGPYKQLTPRYTLQTLGTEWGRSINHSVWNDWAKRAAFKLLNGGHAYVANDGVVSKTDDPHLAETKDPDWVVVIDGRFRNEILNIKAVGGVAVRIVNPTSFKQSFSDHRSETELGGVPGHFYDMILLNDKAHGLKALERAVDELMWSLTHGRFKTKPFCTTGT